MSNQVAVAGRSSDKQVMSAVQPQAEMATFGRVVRQCGDHVTRAAGLDRIEGLNLAELFSDVFQRRSVEQLERQLTVGTEATTPKLDEVQARWPKPWVFARALAMSIGVFLLFWFGLEQFGAGVLVPGLISVGAFALPAAVLIFIFELNVLRNVSFYQVSRLVLLGGALSMLLSLLLFQFTGLHEMLGPPAAGIVEELGKAACLLLVLSRCKYRWTLNGLLFGAAIGMGFAAFESAGYAFQLYLHTAQLVSTGYVDLYDNPILTIIYDNRPMIGNIALRGVLSVVAGHILWTAAVGGALWRVRGERPFDLNMLKDRRFLRVLAIAVVLHMLWNLDLGLPLLVHIAKWLILGFISWVVLFGLVQAGLEEVRAAQRRSEDSSPDDLSPTVATPRQYTLHTSSAKRHTRHVPSAAGSGA